MISLEHRRRCKQRLELLAQLTRRDIVARYRGSVLGVFWSFITPLLLVGVYTFVFSVIFSPRWLQESALHEHVYGFNLFVGVLMHAMLAESITRAPGLIPGHANYVTKVVFPLYLLPTVVVLSALFHLLLGLLALIVLAAMLGLPMAPGALLALPLVLLPLLLLCNGLVSFLAALGVYFRDLNQLIAVAIVLLMFMSPVFYPLDAVPEQFRSYLLLNPMTHIIENARRVILLGEAPDHAALLTVFCVAVATCLIGVASFQKLRRGFADVL